MEQLLHYIWKHRLFQNDLKTTDGLPIEVLDTGIANTDEGPDFFNAKIKIDGKIWIGNIEIHKHSSDWYAHKHDTNPAYNSIILHVVEVNNREIINQANRNIVQCQINCPQYLKDNVEYLLNADVNIPCYKYISTVPQIHLNSWLNTLLIERLERKSNDINKHLQHSNGSWEEVFYILLSRNFGFGLNSDSFERLALSLPLRFIQKQGDNITQIEALLFGQAGLLEDEEQPDEYSKKLKKEYNFLRNKYSLTPIDSYLFRKMRVRPSGSPHIRIAQLAALLYNAHGLFSKILKSEDIGQIRLLFHQNTSEYWQTHYLLGEESPRKSKYPGNSSLDIILINTVVPILFAYGKATGNEALCERSFRYLEQIKPESNFITKDFAALKIEAKNAYDSQAQIQLRREYCEKKKCLFCRIGYRMLSENKK
ncbi:DUF2851 family protein [Dysgonomonas sp. 216]|uniref:DUF2851 family protein n=1 Tax=Dysgonomonas sp. 216 TaxID=2302934 RepID=UPI0013D7DEEC|nr:DUF2851 family protein [Dysgonomonas sp. 216]NDW19500.1 DUF2851 family protein [Dysgonomonas sp. 216]